MKKLIVGFLFIFSTEVFSKGNYAVIVGADGNVSQKELGALSSRTVDKAEKLKAGTRVITGKGSYAEMRFLVDNSRIYLGEETEIVIEKIAQNAPHEITLIKGVMRASLSEDLYQKIYNTFIKTKNALLGTSHGDVLVSYRPENQITSVLSFNNNVTLNKIESWTRLRQDQQLADTSVQYDINSKNIDLVKAEDINEISTDVLLKNLIRSDRVLLKPSRFSAVVAGLDRPILPTAISPVQFSLLNQNVGLRFRKKGGERIDLKKMKSLKASGVTKLEVSPHGYFKGDDYLPRSGGLFDIYSGVYIPPMPNSPFSVPHNLYIATEVGDVDSKTGSYIHPKGLWLNPNEGFTVAHEDIDLTEERKAQIEFLNQNIKKEIIFGESEYVLAQRRVPPLVLPPLAKIQKETISFEVTSLTETIETSADTISNVNLEKSSGMAYKMNWFHKGVGNWQFFNKLGFRTVDFSEETSFFQASDALIDMAFGMKKNWSDRWDFLVSLGLNQTLFVDRDNTDNSNILTKVNLTQVKLGLEGIILHTRRKQFNFMTDLSVTYNLPKTAGDLEVGSGIGYRAGGSLNYWINNTSTFSVKAFLESSSFDVSALNFSASESISDTGFSVGLTYLL